jgi:hypothetical protein
MVGSHPAFYSAEDAQLLEFGFLSVGKALNFKHPHRLGFRLLETSSRRGAPRPTFLVFDLLHSNLHKCFLMEESYGTPVAFPRVCRMCTLPHLITLREAAVLNETSYAKAVNKVNC